MSFDNNNNRQRMPPPPPPPPPGSYHPHPHAPHPHAPHPRAPHPYYNENRSGGAQDRFRDSRPTQRSMRPPPSRYHPPSSSTIAPQGNNNNYVHNHAGESNNVYRRNRTTYSCNHNSVYSRNRSLHRHHQQQRNENIFLPRNNNHPYQQQQRHATSRADDTVRNKNIRKRRHRSDDDDDDDDNDQEREEEEGVVLEEVDLVAEARKAVEMVEEVSGEGRAGSGSGSDHRYKRLRNDNGNGNRSATANLDDRDRKIVPPLPPPSHAASFRSSNSDNAKHTVELNKIRNPVIQKQEIIDLCSDDDDDDDDKHVTNNDLLPSHDNSNAITTTTTTHIVFAIDSSGSMRNEDVTTKNGKITRWNAVFECIDGFLVDQIEQQGGIDKKGTASIVSVLTFDNEAKALVQHMPLIGDGRKVRKKLDAARKAQAPKGGTGFAAGLGLANQICSMASSGKKLTTEEAHEQNTIVVFLSDGRPGDLQLHPPSGATVPMQTTFRRNKKTYPAAGTHIEEMKERHGDRFALHMICISKEGKSVRFTL